MIAVTFNGNPAYLIDDLVDWSDEPELKVQLPGVNEQGLSGIETRRLQGDTLRLSLNFTAVVQGPVAVTNLRNSLQALSTEPVLCPFWPGWFQPGETPPMTAEYYVEIGDGSAPTIVAASALPLTRPACPLMVGRLTDWPDPELLTDDYVTAALSFTENDDSYLTPTTFVPPTGLAIAGGGVSPLFPFRADWATAPKSDGGMKDIDRQKIGQSRVTSDSYYTQLARRKAEQAFTLYDCEDVWNLLAFFGSIGVGNFWLPIGISEARLTGNVASGDSSLAVDNVGNIGNNTYVCLDDLAHRKPVQVTGTSGSSWTLSGAVGTAFVAEGTRLESMILARFDGDTITLRFTDVGWCETALQFREVPYEVAGATTETYGSTFGTKAASAYLYKFEVAYPGGTNVFAFTSYERDLTMGGTTYQHGINFEHDPIQETDTLDRQSVQITSRNASSNPLTYLAPFALEYPLYVTVTEVDVSGNTAINPTVFFYGEVTTLEPDGPFLKATAESNSAIFDVQVPNRLYQNGCNWILFSGRCGLLAANWTWAASTTAWDGIQVLTIGSISSSNGATLAANFFAGGYVQVKSGALSQFRFITQSTALSSGTLQLTLAQTLLGTIANGTTVTVLPGCDGLKATCETKYNNFVNIGGFPFMPVANPTLVQTQSINSGKK